MTNKLSDQPSLETIHHLNGLSEEARMLIDAEALAPVNISIDNSLRLKMLDQCGMACTFCHNEGTPVTADNATAEPENFVSGGKSSRVSIYLGTNGVNFVSGMVKPDERLDTAIEVLGEAVPFNEIHLTGGEPTLHPELTMIVKQLADKDMTVKITSNGERFYAVADQLKAAGLSKVVFSIFGTTPQELADVQGAKFNNPKFAKIKLDALARSIEAANEEGIAASANIVMPDSSHADRIKKVIEQYGDTCKIRILNSLDEGAQSYNAVYELLASMGAEPIAVNLTAGASGMSIDYRLPDGKEVGFKQIRHSYLNAACGTCDHKGKDCDEGYYGVRMYVDRDGGYQVGVCIQRMDLTRPLSEFVSSDLPEAIVEHRIAEYNKIVSNTN